MNKYIFPPEDLEHVLDVTPNSDKLTPDNWARMIQWYNLAVKFDIANELAELNENMRKKK